MKNISAISNRVLIADDDAVVRRVLAATIVNAGYIPVEAADGREAFRILQRDSDFKAAIFDWLMPHLTGLDLVTYMATEKRLQRIPSMLITADGNLSVMTQSFLAGAVAYLPKPFTAEQAQTAMRMLLAKRRQLAA